MPPTRLHVIPGDGERNARQAEDLLRTAARQQEAVAHLGQQALAGVAIPSLLDTAAALVTRGLEVEFSEILEFQPERRSLILRAGTGWRDGRVGRVVVSAEATALSGYALAAAGPVVIDDTAGETRFEIPRLLKDHGIASGMAVVIHGKERPFGVLGAYSARPREFTTPEVLFVQAVAHVLATSIERARVEDALRKSEEHFRSLIENASDIVTIITDDGTFRYVSPSVERLLGHRTADLLGQTAFEYMHPDDLGPVLDAIQRAIAAPGTTQSARFRFRHRDGSWRVLESIGMARRDRPDAYSIIVNSRDITERERQEQALHASKERLRTVVAGAPVILFALDRQGDFTFAEGKGLDLLGVRPGQLVGRSAFALFADLPDVLGHVRRALQGESFSSTVDLFGLQFEAWFSPLREGGRIAGVIGVATDITERRRAEEALERSAEANRHLLAHAPFGIYRVGSDGRFLGVNPALVEMLGYATAEALEAAAREPDLYVEPADRERYLARLSAGQRAAEVETFWTRGDGKVIRVRLYGRAVRHDDGRIECFEVFAEDVTDRRMLEDQLRQSQKMEALGQLTGGIAHDFNNLLTVVLANAELLQKDFGPGHETEQADIRDIISAALSGRMMVNQLLGFARRSSLSLEAVHLGHALLDLSSVLRRVLPEDIEMLVFADEDLPEVQADRHAVEQILFNLVNNSRDAMPHGGVLRIETSCTWLTDEQRDLLGPAATREYVCLAVDDTGHGMDEDTRERVFEPFFTTKPQGKGTGLGMATVYGLVRQHGGFIQVDSTPGTGTRVRVYFPVAEEPAGIVDTAGAAAPVRGGHETILVVEDQRQLRRATTLILEEAGYRVLAAADGQEALEVLRRHAAPIHCVLTDVVMPRLSGRALYDQARRDGKTMPFLFASGYVGIEGGDREPLDPSLPFLRKPWSRADLLARLRELLDADARRPPAATADPTPRVPSAPDPRA